MRGSIDRDVASNVFSCLWGSGLHGCHSNVFRCARYLALAALTLAPLLPGFGAPQLRCCIVTCGRDIHFFS